MTLARVYQAVLFFPIDSCPQTQLADTSKSFYFEPYTSDEIGAQNQNNLYLHCEECLTAVGFVSRYVILYSLLRWVFIWGGTSGNMTCVLYNPGAFYLSFLCIHLTQLPNNLYTLQVRFFVLSQAYIYMWKTKCCWDTLLLVAVISPSIHFWELYVFCWV